MFIDELKITAKAGNGGNGVVRWRKEKYKPKGGPSGGNGGHGGDVFVEAVPDMNYLRNYVGRPDFAAYPGTHGTNQSQHGQAGEDCIIKVPVGSRITDIERHRTYTVEKVGQRERILRGGGGGLGNEHFKSSTNVAPEESTEGNPGEYGEFLVEVSLIADVGLVGLPNAGKSTLINSFTNAQSEIGAYPFTTLEPHLGDLDGRIIADIPGVIAGAAAGKGLGHKFLRHISRTNMILHLVSVENEDPENAYYTIEDELKSYDPVLCEKESWIVITKSDLVEEGDIQSVQKQFEKFEKRVFVISQFDEQSLDELKIALLQQLEQVDK